METLSQKNSNFIEKNSQESDCESQDNDLSKLKFNQEILNPEEDEKKILKNIVSNKQIEMHDPFCAVCKKPSNINCGPCQTFSYCSKKCKTVFLSTQPQSNCFFLEQEKIKQSERQIQKNQKQKMKKKEKELKKQVEKDENERKKKVDEKVQELRKGEQKGLILEKEEEEKRNKLQLEQILREKQKKEEKEEKQKEEEKWRIELKLRIDEILRNPKCTDCKYPIEDCQYQIYIFCPKCQINVKFLSHTEKVCQSQTKPKNQSDSNIEKINISGQNNKKFDEIVKPNCANCNIQSKLNCECLNFSYCSRECKIKYQHHHTQNECIKIQKQKKQIKIYQKKETQKFDQTQISKPFVEEEKFSSNQQKQIKNEENQQRGIGGFRGKINIQQQSDRNQVSDKKIEFQNKINEKAQKEEKQKYENNKISKPFVEEEKFSSYQQKQIKNDENQQRGIGGFRGKINIQQQNGRNKVSEKKIDQRIDSRSTNQGEYERKNKNLNDFYKLITLLKDSIKDRDVGQYSQDLKMSQIQFQVKSLFDKNDPKTVENKLLVYKLVFSILKGLIKVNWDKQLSNLVNVLLKENFFFKESINIFRDLVKQSFKNQNQQNEKTQLILSMVKDLYNWTLINEKLVEILPDFELNYLPAKQIYIFSSSIKSIVDEQQIFQVSDNEQMLQTNYQNLLIKAEEIFKKISEASGNQEDSDDSDNYNEVPVNFRHMSIIPTISDLNDKQDPKLRSIEKKGKFKNLEIYLDSNFRLLREDFMRDLREGFQLIQKSDQQKTKKQEDSMHLLVRSYKNARIFGVFAAKQFFGLRIQIQTGKNSNRIWSKGKNLQYGQLVLFSDDLFKDKIYFGIVRENDGEENYQSQMAYGHLTIYVEIIEEQMNDLNAFEIYKILNGKNICLIESKSYFEAYVHVLKCLQDTDQNSIRQFQKMIIKVDKSFNRIPDLWNSEKMQQKIVKFAQDNNLDEMQSQAFQSAFQYNISLIQGPPGTGKTYVGEKIVDFMLQNLRTRNGLASGPILITCYTNHALDQFVEKILLKTKNVIRIGGNSRNESFGQYSIVEMKKKNKTLFPRQYWGYKNKLDRYLIEFENINKTFIKVCNMPIITSIDQISLYSQTFQEIFKTFVPETYHQYGFNNDSDDSQEYASNDIVLQIIDWVKQAQKSFDYELEQIIKKYNPLNQQKIKKFLEQKACFSGNAHILRWLGILDIDLIAQKGNKEKEEAKKQEKNEIDYEDQDYGDNYINKMYEEKFQEIKNYSEYSFSLYKFLNQNLFIKNVESSYQQIFELKNSQFGTNSENYQQQFQDLIIRISRNKLPNDFDKVQEQDKWLLNFGLIEIIRNDCNQKLQRLTQKILEIKTLMDQVMEDKDVQFLQKMDVIAMTTTGAAKYKKLLQKISSKIMVVEEAAEILESHIFTSLNPDIQQLVLIGDHQQLRPNLNAFELAEYYNLDLSLFERLINNNFQFAKLSQQRRMRPEISQIIKQIYPDLQDSETVQERPQIRGLNNKNYFFFDHVFPEEEIKQIKTKCNQKEAEMIVGFYKYLLKQKYQPDQITILSLYTGQLLKLREIINENIQEREHKSVKICTVDNYQGEENDIILLSLVRSNSINQIGFLKISNRICVALSRARNGLYIFGNQQCLKNATDLIDKKKNKALLKNDEYAIYSEHLWKKVLNILQTRNDIGDKIVLSCKHNIKFHISQPSDFIQCQDGGCNQFCGQILECRHICEKLCHFYEYSRQDKTGHDDYKCLQDCVRPRKCGHKCLRKCFQCKNGKFEQHKDACYYSAELLLNCSHVMKIECHEKEKPDLIQCNKNCDRILQCGHKCKKICAYDCKQVYDQDKRKGYISPCKEEVQRVLECGHTVSMDCGQQIGNVQCQNGC